MQVTAFHVADSQTFPATHHHPVALPNNDPIAAAFRSCYDAVVSQPPCLTPAPPLLLLCSPRVHSHWIMTPSPLRSVVATTPFPHQPPSSWLHWRICCSPWLTRRQPGQWYERGKGGGPNGKGRQYMGKRGQYRRRGSRGRPSAVHGSFGSTAGAGMSGERGGKGNRGGGAAVRSGEGKGGGSVHFGHEERDDTSAKQGEYCWWRYKLRGARAVQVEWGGGTSKE